MKNFAVGFTPKAGQHVLVRGRVTMYEARGDYQLIVEHLEEAGVGALKREFERLKAKLAAEGLFSLETEAGAATLSPAHRRDHVTYGRRDSRRAPYPGAAVSACFRGHLSDGRAGRGCNSRDHQGAGRCQCAR